MSKNFLNCMLCCLLQYYNNMFIALCYRKIKVWDLVAALDPRALTNSLCIRTLVVRYFTYFILFCSIKKL